MTSESSYLHLYRRGVALLCGVMLMIGCGIYFGSVSAGNAKVELVEDQAILTNGKIAFSRRSLPGGERSIRTSNPDGSGSVTIPLPDSMAPMEPTWSPDGNKLAITGFQSGSPDIFSVDMGGGVVNLTNTATPIEERNASWSSTGKIAYERINGSSLQIWVMNADGGSQTQFPGIAQASAERPAWSPDGSKLAYAADGEIWVINADGSNPHAVTANASADTDPAWSPDGMRLLFAKGGSGISVINANGTSETPITVDGGTQPAWSPDGTKIAFYRNGVRIMDADGGNQLLVVPDTTSPPPVCCNYYYENPSWQPVAQVPGTISITGRITQGILPAAGVVLNLTGASNATATTDAAGNYQFSNLAIGGNYQITASLQRYLFSPPKRSFNSVSANVSGVNFEVIGVCYSGNCRKTGQIAYVRSGEVWAMNADGSSKANMTNNAAFDANPNYSPDGSNFVFDSNRDSGFGDIYRQNAPDAPAVRITTTGGNTAPFYSPDARFIYFVSNRDGNSEIYRMNADGSNQIRLTNDPANDYSPAVSPDGNRIVFISTRSSPFGTQVWMMNSDGSDPRVVPGNVGYNVRPLFTPDGNRIITTNGPDAVDQRIWTMNLDGSNRTMISFGRNNGTYSPDYTKIAVFCCFNVGPFANEGIWVGNATNPSATGGPYAVNNGENFPHWQGIRAPRTAFDFDGDGRSDPAIFRPSTTDWWHFSSAEGAHRANAWGQATDVLAPADYDGDLKTDHAVWRPSSGDFHILNSFDFTVRIENFGLSGDIPTGGDWDGDSRADLAVYRPGGAQGVFYYRGTMGNPQGNISVIAWGVAGDKPVVGDYDADSRADAAIYRPSTGTWYVNRSSDGQLIALNFGLSGDTPVPADYDSDGRSDIAVFRAGVWYLMRSTQGFAAFQFGLAGDKPVPADYDGDGRADAAIYRDGVWWILKSTSGAEAVAFGLPTDVPIQAAYNR